ncbi:muconolactone Delta-isomerase family protein [Streptomyces sp. INA 01156]
MQEFLVEITTTIPEGTSQAEVDRRRAAEAVRAGSSRRPATWPDCGARRRVAQHRGLAGRGRKELREKVLGTLPLRPWMTLTVTPLEPHPNDPGRATDGTE